MTDRLVDDLAADKAARLHANPRQAPSVHSALFGTDDPTGADRTLLPHIAPIYRATLAEMGVADPDPRYLTDILLPLVRFLGQHVGARRAPALIGLGGGPGAGKSTLSRLLARCLPAALDTAPPCLSLSLDDFYRSRAARKRMGFKWRTLPGTHDTDRLAAFLADFDRRRTPLPVPRYDLGRDAPADDEWLPRAPALCVFDGAMVGADLPGYDRLAARLDLLIFLDAPVGLLKRWRFEREARLRDRSGGRSGFPPRDMEAFWLEALRPSIDAWVRPNAARADLVIRLGPDRRVLSATLRDPAP